MAESQSHPAQENVSRQLFQFRVIYFSSFAAFAIIFPYFNIFLQDKGQSKEAIGYVSMIPRVFSFVIAPIWSLVADKYQIRSKIYMINTVISTFTTMAFLSITNYSSTLFVAALVSLRAFFSCPCGALLDSISTEVLKEHYGDARAMGAVSVAIISLVGGIVLQFSGTSFDALFYFFLVIQIFNLAFLSQSDMVADWRASQKTDGSSSSSSIYIPAQPAPVKEVPDIEVHSTDVDQLDQRVHRQGILANLSSITRIFAENKSSSVVFAAVVFFSGIGFGVIESFLFIQLVNLGGSGLLLGSARFIMTIVEVPVFRHIEGFSKNTLEGKLHLSKPLAQWILLLVTQLAFVARFAYYSVLSNPWFVFPAEILHGFTFACMWKLSVSYSSQLAADYVPSASGTMQTLLSGLHFGIAAGLGSAVGGIVFERFGAKVLFQVCALLASVSSLLAAGVCVGIWRRDANDANEQLGKDVVASKRAASSTRNVATGTVQLNPLNPAQPSYLKLSQAEDDEQ